MNLLFEDKAESKNECPYCQSHTGNEKSTCLIDIFLENWDATFDEVLWNKHESGPKI